MQKGTPLTPDGACKQCGGEGIYLETHTRKVDGKQEVVRQVSRFCLKCEAGRREMLREAQRLEKISGLEGEYLPYRLEHFERDEFPNRLTPAGKPQLAIRAARQLLKEGEIVTKAGTFQGLYIWGDVGVGKTALLAALCNEFNHSLIPSITIDMVGFLHRLKKAFNSPDDEREEVQKIYDMALRVPVLCINDLGAERGTGYVAELLYELFDRRSARLLTTCISANQSLESLRAHYSAEDDTQGARIVSRLGGLCFQARMEGIDLRQVRG